ncbi:MAG: class I SAM-dependent methyltransferase [candidate division FCPU426 bacterium]
MFLYRWVGKQFRKPAGWLGHWVARVMEKRNQECYDRVVNLLQVKDEDRILEIGFGTGLAIRQITEQNPRCRILGLDFSRLMLRKAARNNRAALRSQQVRLALGEFSGHDFGAETFTKIFIINVVYFWDDLPRMFSKIHRLLDKDGCLVMYLSGPERLGQLPFAVAGVFRRYTDGEVQNSLRSAGFSRIERDVVLRNGQQTFFFKIRK